MPHPYSEETQRILDDLLHTLSKRQEIDPDFLSELRQMMNSGKLDNRTRIQQAIAILEARADDLYD